MKHVSKRFRSTFMIITLGLRDAPKNKFKITPARPQYEFATVAFAKIVFADFVFTNFDVASFAFAFLAHLCGGTIAKS